MGTAPSVLYAVPDELGLYFRPGRADHKSFLQRLLEEEHRPLSGAVLDPCYEQTYEDVRRELRSRRCEVVLDTQALQLATPGGFERPRLQKLLWAGNRMHRPKHLAGGGGLELADQVAKHAIEKGYTAVLSPSHFIQGPGDPWFEVDQVNTARLRRYLDAVGGEKVLVYYMLAVHSNALRDPEQRREILRELAALEIDGVFLRVHPFGQDAGSLALRRYIAACHDLHQLGAPVVADQVGTAGLPLLAFGAVGGITAGMTVGDKFDAGRLARIPKPSDSKPFSAPRVYLESIGAYLSRKQAEEFFARENRTQAKFGCKDKRCCKNGVRDMIADPRRHFFYARLREVAAISRAPAASARVDVYMNDILRPAADRAGRAAQLADSLGAVHARLVAWRDALRVLETSNEPRSQALAPKGKRVRRPRNARRQRRS